MLLGPDAVPAPQFVSTVTAYAVPGRRPVSNRGDDGPLTATAALPAVGVAVAV
nr:hypothetical protein [Hymenobacter rubidus]